MRSSAALSRACAVRASSSRPRCSSTTWAGARARKFSFSSLRSSLARSLPTLPSSRSSLRALLVEGDHAGEREHDRGLVQHHLHRAGRDVVIHRLGPVEPGEALDRLPVALQALRRLRRGPAQAQRDAGCGGHVHLRPHGAHGGDEPHHPVHLARGLRVADAVRRLWPGRRDERAGPALVEAAPELLGDEGHEGVEQAQDGVQHPGGGGAGLRPGRAVGTGQHRLGELQIPVAEDIPGEVVDRARRRVEAVGVEGCGHGAGRTRGLAHDPAVDPALGLRGIEAGDRRTAIGLAEARRVPELGGEVAVAGDAALGELDVAPLRLHRGEGEAQRIGAVGLDQRQRVDHVALALGHLLPLLVAHQGMDVDRAEGDIAHEVKSEHRHPGDPEEDDVEAGDQVAVGVVGLERVAALGPAEGREGPEARAEPGVQHVLVAGQRLGPAVVARRLFPGLGLGRRHEDLAVGAVPGRDAVAPPELARDAPGLDVAHPLEIGARPALGHEADAARFHRLDRRPGEGLGVDIPLVGQPRLDHRAGAVAVGHGVEVRLDPLDQVLRLQVGQHACARVRAVEAAVGRGRALVQPGLGVEQVDDVEPVPAADLEIVEVVGRRDLHRARALFRVGIRIGDDGQAAADQRQHGVAADEAAIARVVGVHGDGGIAQHGLGPGGGDGDVRARPPLQRIADMPEPAVLHLALLHLQVGDRGAQHRVPVDQALVAVDQALAVEGDEDLDHRPAQALVHGEALPRPVGRGAEAAELAPDRAPRFGLPRPDALDERVAPQGAAVAPVGGKLALDHHLRRDPGMVHARLPERVAAALAAVAGQYVLQRVVERMAHVEAAGDVGRRHHHAPGLSPAGASGESAAALPEIVETALELGRPIGLVQHRRFAVLFAGWAPVRR